MREAGNLDYSSFYASVFEIVDSWTDDLEEGTYVRFLELLLARISRPVLTASDEGVIRTDEMIDDLSAINNTPAFERVPSWAATGAPG